MNQLTPINEHSLKRKVLLSHHSNKYKPSYCNMLLEMAQDKGLSLSEIAVACNVSRSGITAWMERFPEFKETVQRIIAIAQKYWEEKIYQYVVEEKNGVRVNTGLAKILLQSRFEDYREYRNNLAMEIVNHNVQRLPEPLMENLQKLEAKIRNNSQRERK